MTSIEHAKRSIRGNIPHYFHLDGLSPSEEKVMIEILTSELPAEERRQRLIDYLASEFSGDHMAAQTATDEVFDSLELMSHPDDGLAALLGLPQPR